MVVKVNRRFTHRQATPAWHIWFGPAVFASLVTAAALSALASPLPLSPPQIAGAATVALLGIAIPLLHLARDLTVGEFGIEAHLFRGSNRYLRFYEIDAITLRRRAIGPARLSIEDVYGHKFHLKGNPADLEPVMAGVERRVRATTAA